MPEKKLKFVPEAATKCPRKIWLYFPSEPPSLPQFSKTTSRRGNFYSKINQSPSLGKIQIKNTLKERSIFRKIWYEKSSKWEEPKYRKAKESIWKCILHINMHNTVSRGFLFRIWAVLGPRIHIADFEAKIPSRNSDLHNEVENITKSQSPIWQIKIKITPRGEANFLKKL